MQNNDDVDNQNHAEAENRAVEQINMLVKETDPQKRVVYEQFDPEPHYKRFNQLHTLKVYKDAQPQPECVLELPCGLRKKNRLPCRLPWGK